MYIKVLTSTFCEQWGIVSFKINVEKCDALCLLCWGRFILQEYNSQLVVVICKLQFLCRQARSSCLTPPSSPFFTLNANISTITYAFSVLFAQSIKTVSRPDDPKAIYNQIILLTLWIFRPAVGMAQQPSAEDEHHIAAHVSKLN